MDISPRHCAAIPARQARLKTMVRGALPGDLAATRILGRFLLYLSWRTC
jgi:hypothetical protein